MILRTIVLAAVLLAAAPAVAQKKNDAALAKKVAAFDAYIQKTQRDWNIPGLSVAVVKDGKVLLAKGYGVRTLGSPEPVDAQTLFACASTTKAMTATLMAMLVDEGKLSWNDPVEKHLPEFKLYDPYMTREITLRDLLVHDTGVGNADFLWGIMDINSNEVLKKMRDVKPSYSIRSSFIYQNIFYLAAGKVIEKTTGQTWDEVIKERIFKPLGMTRTVPLSKLATDKNKTAAHWSINGKVTPIEHSDADQIAPAGAVWSCASDMAKWMQVMLDSSKYNGGRLLSPQSWTEMFKPQVMVPEGEFYPSQQLTKPHWTTYGLGWFQQDYKGRKMNFHTGSLDGATALAAQLPDENLAIYIFGNLDHAEARHALVYKAFDHFALGGTRDWSAEFMTLYATLREKQDKATSDFESKRVADTHPSQALDQYAGKYTDPLYGECEVTRQGTALVVDVNHSLKVTAEHWHYDTFRGLYNRHWYGNATIVFSTDATGTISKVNFDGIEFSRPAKP